MNQPKKILDRLKAYFNPKPLFAPKDRIKLKIVTYSKYSHKKAVGVVYYDDDEECLIKRDMVLIFDSEDKHNYYFRVASNFIASDINARDKAIVYWTKKEFNNVKYIKQPY